MKYMMKFMLLIVTFTLLSATSLVAQNLVGTWQGTLQPPNGNRGLRTVIKITRAPEDESLKGQMYSIDQGARPIQIGTITQQGPAVKMLVPGIGGTYEGRFSDDGNTIAGTWTQGAPIPLNLTRATEETAWAIPEPPPPVKPMAADADPKFEVAVIKPSRPGAPGKAFRVAGRQFSTLNTTLSDLITFAYGLHPKQIASGPDWLESEKYDLLAQPDGEGQPNDRQWKAMIQKLLADRFKLTFHREKQELSVYALTVAKTGAKLTKSAGDPDGLPGLFFRGLGVLTVTNATMVDFAGLMQTAVLDRPVVDQTGLTGRSDFTLTWRPDEFQFRTMGGVPATLPANVADAPDLYSAIQDQLGLKLDSTKAPADVIVIDHVERPSEN